MDLLAQPKGLICCIEASKLICPIFARLPRRASEKVNAMSIVSKAESIIEKNFWGGVGPINAGKNAPEFALADQEGKVHALSGYKGKNVVVYFYPKDDTPGCTKEACSFRDMIAEYHKRGIIVLGISGDDLNSHVKFAAKHKLNFPILSDPGFETCKKYGVYGEKKFMGKTYNGIRRTTFIVGPDGVIAHVIAEVDVEIHANQILALIK